MADAPFARRDGVNRFVQRHRSSLREVPADPDFARRVLEDAIEEELDLVMVATARGRYRKAATLAYDAARKSIEAVMLAAGLTVAKGEGGHRVVVGFAEAELVETDAERRDARGFTSARIARHADEYPDRRDPRRSERELRTLARTCVRVVNHSRERLGMGPRPDLVPTDDNVRSYLDDG